MRQIKGRIIEKCRSGQVWRPLGKKTLIGMLTFILAAFLCAFATQSAVARDVTFILENERGVPQPIELRKENPNGSLQKEIKGFGQIVLRNLNSGDVFYITRSYWPGTNIPMAPEKKGFRYQIGDSAAQTVKKTVQSIKTKVQPKPVSKKARGLLGFINDKRAESGLERVPRLNELDKITSIWAQQVSVGIEPDPRLLWNADAGGGYPQFTIYYPWVSITEFSRYISEVKCGSYSPCINAFFLKSDHISVAYVNDSVFALTHSCVSSFCPESSNDFGDASLIRDDFCQNCNNGQTNRPKKDPRLRLLKFPNGSVYRKAKRILAVRVGVDKGSKGRAVLVVRQGRRSVSVPGRRSGSKFIFRIKMKDLKKKGIQFTQARSKVRFTGRGIWRSAEIRLMGFAR